MRKKIKRTIVFTAGIIFTFLGILGLALPFLQGILFLVIGLLLLSVSFPKMRLWIAKQTERHPKLLAPINKVEAWLLKFIGEI